MIHHVDITNFMTWFVSQVVSLFSNLFSILDSITFAGTSVLKVIITTIILSSLVGVVLTISSSVNVIGSRSDKVKERKKKNEKD